MENEKPEKESRCSPLTSKTLLDAAPQENATARKGYHQCSSCEAEWICPEYPKKCW